jgi:hypothetical protein
MIITDRKTKIVFMPVFKSYADPFALHYINYISDLEFGFTFAYYNDTPKVKLVEMLLSRLGYFLLRKNNNHNQHLNYINQSLIQDVIENNQITTCF